MPALLDDALSADGISNTFSQEPRSMPLRFTSTRLFTGEPAWTFTTDDVEKLDQASPFGDPSDEDPAGGWSGLPHEHFTLGTPPLSTITAVPACSTAGVGLAAPFVKPWLVTQ